jgi:phosphoesterase RecJ-like protein
MNTPVTYTEAAALQAIIEAAHTIVIVQADNPDADSLGSALALEHILGEMGKEPKLYCAVDTPTYLRYMSGWDRIQKDLPKLFDASIIVDASTLTLFEKLSASGQQGWLAAKPCIVLDHHETVENPIHFATVGIVDHTRASAGELIYLLAKQLGWSVPVEAQKYLMSSILGDTQGLTNQLASSETYRIMGEFIDNGVNRSELEEARREYGKMPPEIYRYKGQLIAHTEFSADGSIAIVTIPQVEINQYSPLYNPGPLIQSDMLQTLNVRVAIVLKTYDDGKVTAAIRCNPGAPVGAKLAEQFGGGGHQYASGFKDTSGRPFEDIKSSCITKAQELLATLEAGNADETTQHTNQAS